MLHIWKRLIKNIIQEDLPFIKAENIIDNKIKFKLLILFIVSDFNFIQ